MTVLVQVLVQPLALVNTRVRVKLVDAPALTLTVAALAGPLSVPLPVTDQR